MANLVAHDRAARYIKRLDARIKKQLIAKLNQLANDPDAMPGAKAMSGEGGDFSDFATAISA
jgi:mRNA-degrading endonuclease RelE of RelBE toxin-antitoxin system